MFHSFVRYFPSLLCEDASLCEVLFSTRQQKDEDLRTELFFPVLGFISMMGNLSLRDPQALDPSPAICGSANPKSRDGMRPGAVSQRTPQHHPTVGAEHSAPGLGSHLAWFIHSILQYWESHDLPPALSAGSEGQQGCCACSLPSSFITERTLPANSEIHFGASRP